METRFYESLEDLRKANKNKPIQLKDWEGNIVTIHTDPDKIQKIYKNIEFLSRCALRFSAAKFTVVGVDDNNKLMSLSDNNDSVWLLLNSTQPVDVLHKY